VAAISVKHICCLIKEKLKIPSRITAQKPLLKLKMKKKRLSFDEQYCHLTEDDRSTVIYSDENTFQCILWIRSTVRRPSGTHQFESQYTMKTVKHPASLMVWACFSGSCARVYIFFLPPNIMITANGTRVCWRTTSCPSWLCTAAHTHFLQDGAPCHASRGSGTFSAPGPLRLLIDLGIRQT
jgi:hypothetical protein